MQTIFQEVRYALRSLRNRPGFTLATVLTLALGIGATTSLFGMVNGLVLRPLPVKDPHSLVALVLFDRAGDFARQPLSFPLYREFAGEASPYFADLFAYATTHARMGSGGRLRPGSAQLVTGNYFDALGARPQLGRFFAPDEDAVPMRDAVTVISDSLWRRQFNADPGAVGRSLVLESLQDKPRSFTVIGVAPPNFRGLDVERSAPDVWVPSMTHAHFKEGGPVDFRLVGRLRAGATRQQATLALQRAADAIGQTYGGRRVPGYDADGPVEVGLRAQLSPAGRGAWGPFRSADVVWRATALFAGAVGMVLLIACANIANLLLVRAVQRRREFAVRMSLGARPARLLRQVLVESVVLALLGGAAGLLVAHSANQAVLALRPSLLSGPVDLSPDVRVLAFTGLLSVLTGLLFGIVPALYATRAEPNAELKEGSAASPSAAGPAPAWRGWLPRVNTRAALVGGQVAVCLVLLLGAALCLRSFAKLTSVDLGFDADKVVCVPVDLSQSAYREEAAAAFWPQLIERLRRLPGVRSVSFAAMPPFTGSMIMPAGVPEGYVPAAGEEVLLDYNVVGPDYFETIGTPFVRAPHERPRPGGPRQFLVNESFARRYWPGRDPVGLSVSEYVVAGVVKDSRLTSLWEEPAPHAYLVEPEPKGSSAHLLVRSDGDATRLIPAIQRELTFANPDLEVSRVRTMRRIVAATLSDERLTLTVLGAFATAALALAAVGVYGVTSFAVASRTRELGIRTALGARPAGLLSLVMRQAMAPVAVGMVAGLAAAAAVWRAASSLFYGVGPGDPRAVAAVVALLAAVAAAAGLAPALRAMRVDPMAALRHE